MTLHPLQSTLHRFVSIALPKAFARGANLSAACLVLIAIELIVCSKACAQEPLILPFRDEIEFGVISNKTGICRMNRRGRLIGLGGQDCVGNGRNAFFWVAGNRNTVVNIQAHGSQSDNVRFTPRINGRSTKNLGPRGRRNIRVFGDLEITGPAAGRYALGYVLNINYE